MFDPGELLRICLLIQENLESDLSLMFLAQTAGLSRFRFHRVFKASVGETLHDYVIRQRMERAAFELRYPLPRSARRSVKAIAYASGYKSLSSFSHAFTSYAAVSPREYRYRSLAHRVACGQAAGAYIEPATAKVLCQHVQPESVWIDLANRPGKAAQRLAGAGLTLSVERVTATQYLALKPSATGAWADRREAAGSLGGNVALLIDSLPGLYARATRIRTQNASPMAKRAAPMGCFCVETAAVASESMPALRHVPIRFSGGRYLVLSGRLSILKLYRTLLRNFDLWLLETGECPRPDRLLMKFPNGVPRSLEAAAQILLYLPLEEVPTASVNRSGVGA